MALDHADPHPFDIGRVITQTLSVLGRNIITFGALSLILVGLPTLLVGFSGLGVARSALEGSRTGFFDFSPAAIFGSSIGGLATVITTAILQGALIHATVQDLNREPQRLTESLATGLRNFLPLIGLAVLFVLGVGFGFVLLIVPGVMLLCAWCVATPALIAERTGVFGAFGRSADLTRGRRWRIFALLLLVLLAEWVVSAVFSAIMGVSAFARRLDPQVIEALTLNPALLVLSALRSAVGAMIGATAAAVLYVELRRAREGEPTGWLAEVFR